MISSRANAAVKSTYRLRKRGEREKRGVFLVEGHRAAQAALRAGVRLLDVFYTAAAAGKRESLLRAATGASMHAVTPAIMAFLTDHDHPPDIMAIAPMRPAATARAAAGDLTVILAGIHDPAVAGGIMAAAAGANATGLVALAGTCDVFAPACVRAAAGAHFAVPVAAGQDAAAVAAALGSRSVAALSDEGSPVCSENMQTPIALIVGEGPLPETFAAATRVCVPAGDAGVGPGLAARAAVALYHARRP